MEATQRHQFLKTKAGSAYKTNQPVTSSHIGCKPARAINRYEIFFLIAVSLGCPGQCPDCLLEREIGDYHQPPWLELQTYHLSCLGGSGDSHDEYNLLISGSGMRRRRHFRNALEPSLLIHPTTLLARFIQPTTLGETSAHRGIPPLCKPVAVCEAFIAVFCLTAGHILVMPSSTRFPSGLYLQ